MNMSSKFSELPKQNSSRGQRNVREQKLSRNLESKLLYLLEYWFIESPLLSNATIIYQL